jgi:16S rRNA (adenine1518-N6/adenine1519-N6)-dimethyltransferase
MVMKKRLGQNFLHDKNILQKMIQAADLKPTDTVLEIGTGAGFLTAALAKTQAQIHTIEIDSEKLQKAQQSLNYQLNIEFILGDFLIRAKDIFAKLQGQKIKVIANIPYYITTPIIEKLLFYREQIEFIEIMLQKEVAQRLMASKGTKEYGSLTLFVGYYAQVRKICNVSANCFYPKPKVDSAVIQIIPRPFPLAVDSEDLLFRLIRAAFWGRRKTLYNCLRNSVYTKFDETMMTKLLARFPYLQNERGEKLELKDFIELANFTSNNIKDSV